jgi:hypothetical protein
MFFGQTVTFYASVFARYPVMGTPSGSFQFRIDGHDVGLPVALDANGRAQLRLHHLNSGIHWVSGRYGGGGGFTASQPVRLYQHVRRAEACPMLTAQPNVPTVRQRTVLRAWMFVYPRGGSTPTGYVQFRLDGSPLGLPRKLVAGQAVAVLPAGQRVGHHHIMMFYLGAPNFPACYNSADLWVNPN